MLGSPGSLSNLSTAKWLDRLGRLPLTLNGQKLFWFFFSKKNRFLPPYKIAECTKLLTKSNRTECHGSGMRQFVR